MKLKLEIELPKDTLATDGGQEVCDLLSQMCQTVQMWALVTKSRAVILKDFSSTV